MNLAHPELSTTPERVTGVTVVLALHALAAIGLIALAQHPVAFTDPQPIRIEMVTAAQPDTPKPPQPTPAVPLKPAPTPPLPRPVQRSSAPSVIQTEATVPAKTTTYTAPPPSPEPPAAVQPEQPAPAAPVARAAAPSTSDNVQSPRFDADYLHNPAPVYPRASRDLGEEGRVVLRVQVSEDGRALQVLVEGSSGSSRLDRAAREAVAQWRFVPARQGQQAVTAWVKVPIVFELKS